MRILPKRKSLLLLLLLLTCFFWQYVSFTLHYAVTTIQLFLIGTMRYTVMIDYDYSRGLATEAIHVPRILHQTYKTRESIPLRWINSSESCRLIHNETGGWQYMFWSDESGRDFIKGHFSPAALANYDSYKYPIQRVDALRYYLLYHYGGIYIDLDIVCLLPLDTMGLTSFPLILPATRPIGFSNDFIVAAKGHPFLLQLIEQLPHYNTWTLNYYLTIMFSTGPMFVTNQYIHYMKRRDTAIYTLNDTLYGSSGDNLHPAQLFNHIEGSSWHKVP